MSSIFTTISDYQRQLDARDAAAINRLLDLWQQFESDLVKDLTDLITYLESRGGRVTTATLFQIERYRQILAQLNEFYDFLADEGLVEIRRSMIDSQRLGEAMAQAVMAGIVGGTRPFAGLPVGALKQITALAGPGGPLDKILQDAYPLAANALSRQLVSNIGRGRNPRTIVAFARKHGLLAGVDHILLVSRDQSVRAFRQASLLSYQNDPDVIAYRRMAARQPRTCIMCLALDGKESPTSELMAVHPQDRCTVVPVIRGFTPTSWKSGQSWFSEQSEAFKRAKLGVERYQAYQQGRPLTEFVSIVQHETWGPSLRLRPPTQTN